MLFLVLSIHVIISFFLILVVLLQQGQGADLSVFGGGATQTAFGARSAANILHKMTVAGFVAFILTTMTIGFLQTGGGGSSVMSGVDAPAAQETAGEVALDELPAAADAVVDDTTLVDDAAPVEDGVAAAGSDADLAGSDEVAPAEAEAAADDADGDAPQQ